MNDLVRQTIGKVFTPPPMPPEAFPTGNRLVPGVHSALELAWQAMFYQTLTTGITIGAVGVMAIIVGVIFRANLAKSVADHLRGVVNVPH